VLRFYRLELSKRGWSENDGAVVEPGGAAIAFTTADGPALLRLTHQDDRTIVDLSPGKYKVSLKIASGAAQNREFEVAADETWGLVAGEAGVLLPLRLY
jgi:hypothetical protein